jgi:hypothetical protein
MVRQIRRIKLNYISQSFKSEKPFFKNPHYRIYRRLRSLYMESFINKGSSGRVILVK